MRHCYYVLLVCLIAVAYATNETEFSQYNATLYLYSNQPPLATWAALPFSTPVSQVLWWQPLNAFVVFFHDQPPFVASVVPGTGSLAFQPWNLTMNPFGGVAAVKNDTLYYASMMGEALLYVSWCNASLQCVSYNDPVNGWNNMSLVTSLGIRSNGEIVIGTDTCLVIGFFSSASYDLNAVPLSNTTGSIGYSPRYISQLHVRDDDSILVASITNYTTVNAWTTDLVHVVNGSTEAHFYRTPGIIDAVPTVFVADPLRDAVHLGNEVCDNVLYRNGTFQRVSGAFEGGMPQRNITSGVWSSATNTLWFGTAFGVTLLQADGSWKYFFGPRWLPGSGFTTGMRVSALDVHSDASGREVALVATDTGLSVIYSLSWGSMDQKAAFYQSQMQRFKRFGLVSVLQLADFGDNRQYTQATTANDGLWSSIYLGSQGLRYAATGDPAARQEAWDTFSGMQLLINVTGDDSYPARSFVQQTPCASGLYASASMPGYCWQGGTSSDEITGHLTAYPIMYFLVAETAEEKARVAATVNNILGGIVKNSFSLIGAHSHEPTQWGRWGPEELNQNPFWYDGRGVNSNQILSFLVTGYAMTENAAFADAFWFLVNDAHYDDNIINLKITQPSDINFSDDELTFLPYLAFLLGSRMANGTANPLYERIKRNVWLSIERTHAIIAREKPSLYNAIFIGAAQQLAEVPLSDPRLAVAAADGVWWMRTYTVWQIDWPINNAQRLDAIFPHNDVGRDGPGSGTDRTVNLFPYDETTMLRWNSNPFDTHQGTGHNENDPSPFLYAFWAGRYFRAW